MSAVKSVCLLGFGEVGAILAEELSNRSDVTITAWDLLFPVAGSRPCQRAAAFSNALKCASAATAVAASDLVISAVTADQSVAAAASVVDALPAQAWFLDLNSVAPHTKQQTRELIEAGGGRYVEAAVMAPIAPKRMGAPILLAGANARDFLPLAQALGFGDMSVFSERPGQAAATKMCRSVVVKGMEALISEAMLAARHYGVEAEVLSSLNNLFPHPDWRSHAHYMISRTLEHGRRRADEMREVAKTVSDAGVQPWMSTACIERQQWAGALSLATTPRNLPDLLDAISASSTIDRTE